MRLIFIRHPVPSSHVLHFTCTAPLKPSVLGMYMSNVSKESSRDSSLNASFSYSVLPQKNFSPAQAFRIKKLLLKLLYCFKSSRFQRHFFILIFLLESSLQIPLWHTEHLCNVLLHFRPTDSSSGRKLRSTSSALSTSSTLSTVPLTWSPTSFATRNRWKTPFWGGPTIYFQFSCTDNFDGDTKYLMMCVPKAPPPPALPQWLRSWEGRQPNVGC